MKGLLKNNLYAAFSNIKTFSVIMVFLGVFVIAVISQPLLFGYVILSMVGYSMISLTGFNKENTSKWCKYKLAAPVRRVDIVKSYFSSQMIWLAAGMAIALAAIGFSCLLHGFPFDRNMDFFMLMGIGIAISLLMNAIFFPLYYLGDGDKNEAFLIISLLCAVGIIMGISSFINWYFGDAMTEFEQFMGITFIIMCSVVCFFLSIPLTTHIFKRKEF